MMSISSRPQTPPSPLCGLKAGHRHRGLRGAAGLQRAVDQPAASIDALAGSDGRGTSFSGTCEEMREVHKSPSVLNSQK
jgi:hypothetical protein